LRCITEGLTNIARHARASNASVTITFHDGSVLIQVQDNGTGFDLARLQSRLGTMACWACANAPGWLAEHSKSKRAQCGDDAVALLADD